MHFNNSNIIFFNNFQYGFLNFYFLFRLYFQIKCIQNFFRKSMNFSIIQSKKILILISKWKKFTFIHFIFKIFFSLTFRFSSIIFNMNPYVVWKIFWKHNHFPKIFSGLNFDELFFKHKILVDDHVPSKLRSRCNFGLNLSRTNWHTQKLTYQFVWINVYELSIIIHKKFSRNAAKRIIKFTDNHLDLKNKIYENYFND